MVAQMPLQMERQKTGLETLILCFAQRQYKKQ